MILVEKARLESLSHLEIQQMYDLLIIAYAETEKEIWGENYIRISFDEYLSLIQKNEIYLARLEGELVGSVHLYSLNKSSFSFGLLNVNFTEKGKGIGLALINYIEKEVKKEGGNEMHIEILRPTGVELEFKVFLRKWYEKLGYQFTGFDTFINLKPDKVEKAKELIVPSGFECFFKQL